MSEKKKLLVTGISGLLGWNLFHAAQDRFDTYGTHNTIPIPDADDHVLCLDFLDGMELELLVERIAPDVVIHTAAMTRPDTCEREKELAYQVNTEATKRLATVCHRQGARFIHISTDLVFDGQKGEPYEPDDCMNPLGHYADTKRMAEEAIPEAISNYAIVRVALMYGRSMTGDRGSTERVVNTVRDKNSVTLFTDEWRTPILVDDACAIALGLTDVDATGTFHAGGTERITRYAFGLRLATSAGFDPQTIVPGSIHDFQGSPPRIPDVSLDSSKTTTLLGLHLNDIDAGLARLYPGP